MAKQSSRIWRSIALSLNYVVVLLDKTLGLIIQSYLVVVFEYIASFPVVVKHDYNGFSILI